MDLHKEAAYQKYLYAKHLSYSVHNSYKYISLCNKCLWFQRIGCIHKFIFN